jgi:2-C-methyl-D-erythritol 4-phosphate cytidylyltransferase
MALWVIVPAAGVGARMGGTLPKQYLALAGQTVLAQTLQRLARLPGLGRIVVALHPEDPCWHSQSLPPQLPLSICTGGRERSDSVLNALQSLQGVAGEQDWVLVHDAVRPCVRLSDIARLLQQIDGHACGGLLGVPVSSTLKRSNAQGDIVATLPREHVWQAATPQAFRVGALRQALSSAVQAAVAITDEASAMELAGHSPRLVRGSADNIKITYPEDLLLAELILAAQQRESAMAAR